SNMPYGALFASGDLGLGSSGNPSMWGLQVGLGSGGSGVNTGGVGSGNSGPFVFDYNSIEHISMTMQAGGSFWLGLGVAAADLGTQGTDPSSTHIHAMAATFGQHVETCSEAYAGSLLQLRVATSDALNGDSVAREFAIHEIQGSYAPGHQYKPWLGGLPSAAHVRGDATKSSAAVAATRQYLMDIKNHAVKSPATYLYRPKF
ncbi:MAG: hypothetical protein M3N93_08400, partial [Acidobacteriota bacterium]|nr:hypothetical protein [Acidobacteriota bacterium]